MGRARRLSPDALAELWRLWSTGLSMAAIGAALGVIPGTVYTAVRRAARVLTLPEREEISRGLAAGLSIRAIAYALTRAPSTISREIRRHGGPTHYRATTADTRAWRRASRPKRCRLATTPRLRRAVVAKLRADWSPQQIAPWLRMTYPDDATMQISHETIYRTLYVQARGALKQELVGPLRRRRVVRHSRANAPTQQGRGQIVDAVSIAERPPEVEDRAVPGHWEGDLLAGTKWSNIATLVERQSRYVMLVRLRARDADTNLTAFDITIDRAPARAMRIVSRTPWPVACNICPQD